MIGQERSPQATTSTSTTTSQAGPVSGGPVSSGPAVAQDEGNAFASDQMCDGETISDPALATFLAHGPFGPQALQPPTGLGGFDAEYIPATGQLLVRIQGSVDFKDGLLDQSGAFVANHADLNQAAIDGNAITDPVARAAFLAQFQWTGEQDTWIATLQGNVESTWSQQYSFRVDKEGWDCVIASVQVEVDLIAGMCRPGDHLSSEVYKCPDDGSYDVGAFVNSTAGDPHGSTMTLSSRDAMTSDERTARGESLLQRSIGPFGFDSDRLPAGGTGRLDAFANDFIDANNDLTNPVTATGRASSEGDENYNKDLGRRRAQRVADYLGTKGVAAVRVTVEPAGEEGADTDASWRRVDLKVGDGRAQDVGSHEFGHVLGLTDHYDDAGTDANSDGIADRGGTITGTGQPAGTLAGHDALARSIGVTGGAVHENNDGLMALGTNVQASNYSTVGWALQTITRIPEWRINA